MRHYPSLYQKCSIIIDFCDISQFELFSEEDGGKGQNINQNVIKATFYSYFRL